MSTECEYISNAFKYLFNLWEITMKQPNFYGKHNNSALFKSLVWCAQVIPHLSFRYLPLPEVIGGKGIHIQYIKTSTAMHLSSDNNLLQTLVKHLNFFLLKRSFTGTSSPCQIFWPYVLWKNLETLSIKRLLLTIVFNFATFSSSEYLHYTAVVPELDSVLDISKVVCLEWTPQISMFNTQNETSVVHYTLHDTLSTCTSPLASAHDLVDQKKNQNKLQEKQRQKSNYTQQHSFSV